MSVQQRFCPLCNRAFQEGEAVLRCEGCSVMHHPGCWVTNGGCATDAPHRTTPAAMAYSSGDRQPGAIPPHPGEGTRTAPSEPIPLRPPQPPAASESDDLIIGAVEPRTIHHTLPSTVGVPPPARRYQPPPGEPMPRRQLPKIYDRHPLLGYWYVPAAAGVAVLVAVSVIWAFGKLFGGDGASDPGQPTPAATATGSSPLETPTTSVAASPTTPSPRPSTGPGKFSGGDTLVVTGTGECLNVRVGPGRENDAIICLKDGVEVRVTGGPETAGELTWWKVQTELGEGWAAEDYLVKKP